MVFVCRIVPDDGRLVTVRPVISPAQCFDHQPLGLIIEGGGGSQNQDGIVANGSSGISVRDVVSDKVSARSPCRGKARGIARWCPALASQAS
jgi:hypothetical protein